MKPHCFFDILLPFYQEMVRAHGKAVPFTSYQIAERMGMDPVQVRTRCMEKMRRTGYIMNSDVNRRLRGESGGYGPTRWKFTEKFRKWAAAQSLRDAERVLA